MVKMLLNDNKIISVILKTCQINHFDLSSKHVAMHKYQIKQQLSHDNFG